MKKAFTLIELVLVILLVGILIGIATPKFSKSHKLAVLRQASENIAAQIRFAKQYAIWNNQKTCLTFDEENKIFYVIKNDDKLAEYKIPEGLEIESEENEVFFFPTGESDNYSFNIGNGENTFKLTPAIHSNIPVLKEEY